MRYNFRDKIGKEIVTRYYSNLNSSGEFYTDSNGREMLKRKRDYRPTWNVELEEQVSGNYYPITSKISLKDEESQLKLSLLTDRAEGGTSMRDGEIEIMVIFILRIKRLKVKKKSSLSSQYNCLVIIYKYEYMSICIQYAYYNIYILYYIK